MVAIGSLPIIALRRVMPGWVIALGVAGGAGALAAVLARRGLAELDAAAPGADTRIQDAAREAAPGADTRIQDAAREAARSVV